MSEMQRDRSEGEQPSPVEPQADGAQARPGAGGSPSPRRATRTAVARVLIVDAFPFSRLGVSRFLEDAGEMEVCGEADTYASAMTEVRRQRPDLAIISLRLREGDGLDLTRAISARIASISRCCCRAADSRPLTGSGAYAIGTSLWWGGAVYQST